MTTVTWKLGIGEAITLDVSKYQNLMQAAVARNLPRVIGECGGCLSCATCHVYVDEGWIGKIGMAAGAESEMLDVVEAPRRVTSRLSCQIAVSPAIDGLILHVPEV